MMQKLQRFGGAMFTPVLLFAFPGLMLSIATMMQNPMIVGGLASDNSLWKLIWAVMETGAWSVFSQLEIIFVLGLTIGLAKKANAVATLQSLILYAIFNLFIMAILTALGPVFNVDFLQEPGGASGLKMIMGIKTLDTNLIGAIVIALISVSIHNRFYDKKLPDWLQIFQGSTLVIMIGFFTMLPLAFFVSWFWPIVQNGIASIQGFLVVSGGVGVWLYVFLERILIPTGLHHLIYQPFMFGPAVVDEGIVSYWLKNLGDFASSSKPIKELFPAGGFALHNASKMFAPLGISAAFYATAKPEKKKQTLGLLIPTALTSVLVGITEPFEFTFLFLAPQLFVVHAALAATLSMVLYSLGVVGDIGSGFIGMFSQYLVPMSLRHGTTILILFGVGLSFSLLYFVIFRFMILKLDIKTPGREDSEEVKMYSKKDYKEKKNKEKNKGTVEVKENESSTLAYIYLEALGGMENIVDINNCATRLRISVKDATSVKADEYFKMGGAHGIVRNGTAIQIIVGLKVPHVREELEQLIENGG